jgi:hypothetical protein
MYLEILLIYYSALHRHHLAQRRLHLVRRHHRSAQHLHRTG